jgi:hypothetical protein
LNILSSRDPVLLLENRLEACVESLRSITSDSDISIAFTELSTIVEEILACNKCSEAMKLRAEIILKTYEGYRASTELRVISSHIDLWKLCPAATPLGDHSSKIESAFKNAKKWENEANDLISRAIELKHPILHADALLMKVQVGLFSLGYEYLQLCISGDDKKVFYNKVENLIDLTKDVIQRYQRAEILENELHAKIILADLLLFQGNKSAAHSLVSEVLPISETMGFTRVFRLAKDHIECNDAVAKLMRTSDIISTGDQDPITAGLSDLDAEFYAKTIFRMQQLPEDRYAHVLNDVLCSRKMAQLRLNHCRHLRIEQDLSHTFDRSKFYKREPTRNCICDKLHLESTIAYDDWQLVIKAFLKANCAECPYKEPKQPV